MISGNPAQYLSTVLGKLGGSDEFIEPGVAAEYQRVFCTPDAIHSSTEDYRASAGIDLEHDQRSHERGDRIRCDTQVLLAERGASTACSMHTHSGKPNAPRR
jgi:haloacetate dehalogenase